jgi:hypothetical protein
VLKDHQKRIAQRAQIWVQIFGALSQHPPNSAGQNADFGLQIDKGVVHGAEH